MEINGSKVICGICKKCPSQYKCPKCMIDYCSLTCFKDPIHNRCTEKFYYEQVQETLKAEKVNELSDERAKMTKILEKLNNFEDDSDEDQTEDETFGDGENESFLDELEKLDLEELSTEDLESILGTKHLKKIENMIKNGMSKEALIDLGLIEGGGGVFKTDELRPWFIRYKPSEIIFNEELPDFVPKYDEDSIADIRKLTSKTPSDFLWNNLLEVIIIYSFLYEQFSVQDFKSDSIVTCEILPVFFELCSTFNGRILNSAVESIESASSAIFFNSANFDMKMILEYSEILLSNPKYTLIMLSDIRNWFRSGKSLLLALRKVEFLMAWFKRETEESKGSVDKILITMTKIVNNFDFDQKYST